MCGGCSYHQYPYEAQIPVIVDGVRPVKTFRNDDDVKEIIDLIIEETREANKNMGKSFDIANSVLKQLPFFSCINSILKSECQNNISKYLYCKNFSIPAYPGAYGQQPHKWVAKAQIINNALQKRENNLRVKAQKES